MTKKEFIIMCIGLLPVGVFGALAAWIITAGIILIGG